MGALKWRLKVVVHNCTRLPTIVVILCDENSLYKRAQKTTRVLQLQTIVPELQRVALSPPFESPHLDFPQTCRLSARIGSSPFSLSHSGVSTHVTFHLYPSFGESVLGGWQTQLLRYRDQRLVLLERPWLVPAFSDLSPLTIDDPKKLPCFSVAGAGAYHDYLDNKGIVSTLERTYDQTLQRDKSIGIPRSEVLDSWQITAVRKHHLDKSQSNWFKHPPKTQRCFTFMRGLRLCFWVLVSVKKMEVSEKQTNFKKKCVLNFWVLGDKFCWIPALLCTCGHDKKSSIKFTGFSHWHFLVRLWDTQAMDRIVYAMSRKVVSVFFCTQSAALGLETSKQNYNNIVFVIFCVVGSNQNPLLQPTTNRPLWRPFGILGKEGLEICVYGGLPRKTST